MQSQIKTKTTAHSSRGLGRGPLTAETRVRIPVALQVRLKAVTRKSSRFFYAVRPFFNFSSTLSFQYHRMILQFYAEKTAVYSAQNSSSFGRKLEFVRHETGVLCRVNFSKLSSRLFTMAQQSERRSWRTPYLKRRCKTTSSEWVPTR